MYTQYTYSIFTKDSYGTAQYTIIIIIHIRLDKCIVLDVLVYFILLR